MRKPVFGSFQAGSDTNEAVQPQKMPRCLKFQILEISGIVLYLCSKKEAADQLCGYKLYHN